MPWIRTGGWSLIVTFLLLAGCGDASDEAGMRGGGPLGDCFQDEDCPEGLRCVENVCADDDGLPPEKPPQRSHLQPVASATLLWTLSPEAARLSAVDPSSLRVDSISVAAEPVALAAPAGEEGVFVLSRQGETLSWVDRGSDPPRLQRQPLGRRFSALAMAPDASWALLWNPAGAPLDSGIEGLVQLVDLRLLRAGKEAPPVERVVGRRPGEVFFRSAPSGAADVVVVGKDEVSIFSLQDPASQPAAERIELPETHAEPTTRRVVASPDGAHVLIASLASEELAVIDVAQRTLAFLSLPGAPSDLLVSPNSGLTVAVLRAASKVLWFSLPALLADPAAWEEMEVSLPSQGCKEEGPCVAAPGQARLSADDRHAFLFTTAAPARSFGRLDLETKAFEVFDRLRKPLRDLEVAPSAAHVVAVHEPDPASTNADGYEKEVDRSEGYSLVNLSTGATQLRLTDRLQARQVVFPQGGRYAALVLAKDENKAPQVDAVDLETLVPASLPLPSVPEFAGPLLLDHRIWVTQRHPLGRISFVDLAGLQVQTLTGYDFNGRIE